MLYFGNIYSKIMRKYTKIIDKIENFILIEEKKIKIIKKAK